MRIDTLDQGWTLRATAGPVPESIVDQVVPAQVPGTVHTDLLTAGLIVDPYVDLGEAELAWMHRVDWRYERAASTIEPAAADERVDLVLEGLDTVATITLGGVEVGAHREHAPHLPVRRPRAGRRRHRRSPSTSPAP